MRLIRPIPLGSSNIISTTISNTGSIWNPGITYGINAIVMAGDSYFKSVQAANINHPITDPAWWVFNGPLDTVAIFDKVVGSQTKAPGSFSYLLQCNGRIDSIAFLNIAAKFIRIKVSVPTGAESPDLLLYDEIFDLTVTSGINNWHAYYFEELKSKKNLVVLNLPTVYNAKIEFEVINPSSIAKVGEVVIGQQLFLGRTQYGSGVGITDFSKKERDVFGNYQIVERPFSKRGNFNVMIDNNFIDELQETLASLRATPTLYLGVDEYYSTHIFGFYKDFNLVIEHFNETQCSLEIEGLT